MTKKLNFITAFTILSSVLLSESFASSKVKIINNTEEPIKVFFRGKGGTKLYSAIANSNTIIPFKIASEYIENKPIFEVIATGSKSENPDWSLLGGTCSDLEVDKDHTLLIEKSFQGLKTSCSELLKE